MVQLVHELWKSRQGEPKVHCLVGHDWGGPVAWRMTADYPQLINKLVIMNAPHPLVFKKFMRKSFQQFLKSWYIFFFQCPYLPELTLLVDDLRLFDVIFMNNVDGQVFDHVHDGNNVQGMNASQEEIECYKYYFGKPGAMTGPINYYRANFKSVNKSFPAMIDTPTLVIWGRNDPYLSEELAQCQDYVRNFKYQYIDQGSHFVQNSNPDEVNQLVHDFVK